MTSDEIGRDEIGYGEVVIDITRPFRMSPEAMRGLRKATGMQISDIMQSEDEDVRMQAQAFAELHRKHARLGHLPDSDELWQLAALMDIVIENPAVDPLGAESSTTSPPSADSGV